MSGHQHHGHDHGQALAAAGDRRLIVALLGAEVATGALAHSLALLSDAAHMLTDAAAIGLALVATRLARRPRAAR